MCFTRQERSIDGKGVAVSVPTYECCYSFHHADTSADGLLWCLDDGLALSAHYTDLHWEKTGAPLYLRVVRDPDTGETRFRLVRVPTQRMIPLAVTPGPAAGTLPTVCADDGGATVLPPTLARTLARLVARLAPELGPRAEPKDASDAAGPEPTRKDAEDAAAILAAGAAPLPPQLHRAGLVGAPGHTDALAAVCQALFALPEVRAVYARPCVASSLFHAGPANPAMSAVLQLSKLGAALCAPAAPGSPRLAPASLQRMLDLRGAHAHSPPAALLAALLGALDTDEPAYIAEGARCAPLFRFPVEQRVECDRTHAVAYQWVDRYVLELPVAAAAGTAKGKTLRGAACLAAWMAPVCAAHFRHPLFEAEGTAHVTRALARFPRVLAVALDRFDAAGNKVCRTRVAMPDVLDVAALRAHGGAQNDEQYIYDCPVVHLDADADADGAAEPACEPGSLAYVERYFVSRKAMLEHADPTLVRALTDMGYREEDARKAAVIVDAGQRGERNDSDGDGDGDSDDRGARLEAAVRWLVQHRDDAALFFADSSNDASSSGGSSDTCASIARLHFGRSAVPPEPMSDGMRKMVALGFSERHARKALAARYGNVERAAEWVVDNLQRLVQEDARDDETERQKAEAEHQKQLELQAERRLQQREPKYPANTDNARYELLAVVSHCTTADTRNHYVAHIRVPPAAEAGADDKPVWVLCNGTTFAVASAPPLDRGCLYLYRAAPK